MLLNKKIAIIAFGLLALFSSQDALAQSTAPCPSSASQYGCFEVGLPGSKTFAANQPIGAFLDTKTPIKNLVNLILTFALAILVIISVIIIVIGGYMYMTAAGNASQVQSAKEMIMSALLGIFIAFISVVLLNTINPFLGSKAVEPSLGPVGSGAPGGSSSSSSTTTNTSQTTGGNTNTASQIADLQSQEQTITDEISALEAQVPPGSTAPAQLQEQINQDEARLRDSINRVRALENQP